MGRATQNQDVKSRIDVKIKDSEANLRYFETALADLTRKLQLLRRGDAPRATPPQAGLPTSPGRPPPGGQGAPYGAPRPKPHKIDLIKADTPITPAKISHMLHQLEFKLQVEEQYKQGIVKMANLYQADGDKKSRADAESKGVESQQKVQLLQTALKRYRNLHVVDDEVEDEDPGTVLYCIQVSHFPDGHP